MTIKWELIQPGDVLYERRRQKMGNTTISHTVYFQVRVISIDHAAGTALVSWNGNAPRTWRRRGLEKLARSEPKKRARP